MKRLSLLISMCVAASVSAQPKGGLTGGLGPIGGGPPKQGDDMPTPYGPICPGPVGPPGTNTPGSQPKPPTGQPIRPLSPAPSTTGGGGGKALEDRIKALKDRIDQLGGQKKGDLPPGPSVSEAQEALDRLKAAAEKIKRQPHPEDEQEAKDFEAHNQAFHEKFDKDRKAIEEGKKPEGMTAAQWAAYCDEYYRTRAEVEAEGEALKRSLKAVADSQTEAAQKIAEAQAWLDKLKSGKGGDMKELAWRMRCALLEVMKAKLKELEAMKAEREGKESGRKNAATVAAYEKTGDWYVDAMNYIGRQISLMGKGGPPKSESFDGEGGLQVPDWVKKQTDDGAKMNARQRLVAKIKWISRQMEVLSQQLANVGSEARRDERTEYSRYKEELEEADRKGDPFLYDGAKAAERQKKLEAKKAELLAGHDQRSAEKKAELEGELSKWRGELERANKELEAMPK